MKYIHVTTAQMLNRDLSLNATGQEQDWELEVADADRVEEFIAHFHIRERDDIYDFALVSLIVASFDDVVGGRLMSIDGEYFEIFERNKNDIESVYTESERSLWGDVRKILKSNLELYGQIIRYWSCVEGDGHPFASTLLFQRALS